MTEGERVSPMPGIWYTRRQVRETKTGWRCFIEWDSDDDRERYWDAQQIQSTGKTDGSSRA